LTTVVYYELQGFLFKFSAFRHFHQFQAFYVNIYVLTNKNVYVEGQQK